MGVLLVGVAGIVLLTTVVSTETVPAGWVELTGVAPGGV